MLTISLMLLITLACANLDFLQNSDEDTEEAAEATATREVLLNPAVDPAAIAGDEPVFISGTVPFTSPFFLDYATEPFVLLEDQAGFVARDKLFEFALSGQVIGPMWQLDDNTMEFSLSLPLVPQGTLVDVDNNGQEDGGVMVFAVAYWSNIWGGPFLEKREGTGWSSAHATTITDPEQDYEITGGHLIIWAPDGAQQFPTGFGDDKLLFTEDDPVGSVPAGYSIVDLNSEPFRIYKESHPVFELIEGSGEVKDYSLMSYQDAFDAMFEKVSLEYPFTQEKGIDWQALYKKHAPNMAAAKSGDEYYLALRNFTLDIPDAHVGIGFNNNYFWTNYGGGVGLVLAQLSNGQVVVTEVIPASAADKAGIKAGAEISQWGGKPIAQALEEVKPLTAPYSTEHAEKNGKVIYLARLPLNESISVSYENPGAGAKTATLTSSQELDSLFAADPIFGSFTDPVSLPVEGYTLENGFGYIRINSFSDNQNLTAEIWQDYMQDMIDNDVPALILDLRHNSGGSGSMALNIAGYFFDEKIVVEQHGYYNYKTGKFEFDEIPTEIEPAPLYYDGPVAILVSPNCVSACEGFSYYMTQQQRATVVGHYGTAGAYGEVGRGQYKMPGDIDMQFPTGRPETLDGDLVIEGVGILPEVVVPVSYESATGEVDAVLDAAVAALE